MKRLFIKWIQLIIVSLDYVWPKDDNLWVFGSNNGRKIDGNPKAIYDDLTRRGYKCVFISSEKRADYTIVPFKGIRAVIPFLRARYGVISHGLWDFGWLLPSRKKRVIQTWHGIPVKRIGFGQKGITQAEKNDLKQHAETIDSFLVPSPIAGNIFRETLRIPEQKILTIGQPRNDNLVNPRPRTKISEIIPEVRPGAHLVLYAPTFRTNGSSFFRFTDFDRSELQLFLAERNIFLLLRPHISDIENIQGFLDKNILLFSAKEHAEINEVLPDVDLLVTDYSSIFIDYLLVEKPILFACTDIDEYIRSERGEFLMENYLEFIPGPNAMTQIRFLSEIHNLLIDGHDPWAKYRTPMKDQYHSNQSSQTTLKLLTHYGLDR